MDIRSAQQKSDNVSVAPAPVSEIDVEMTRLHNSLSRAQELIDQLTVKLTPVRFEPPVSKTAEIADTPPGTQLGTQLRGATQRADMIISAISFNLHNIAL